MYGIESYIAVPLNRRDGSYFGTLCAFDTQPADLSDADFEVFHLLSQLIAYELEAEERLHKRAAEVRALEDIIAIGAHDLRQPLTILSGRAELLARKVRRGMAPEDAAAGLDDIVAQAGRATRLSAALLDMAQIEMGGLTLSMTEFDLVGLARLAVDEMRTTAPAHTFLLDAPSTLVLSGDEPRLDQVLRNLLGNAAKYAPASSGSIVLSITVVEASSQLPSVQLCVRDHGPGVAGDDLGRLFDRQYRTPDALSENIRGTGLGLYIVRQIVDAHGGDVWAENADGGGLRVCLLLPRGSQASLAAG